MAWCLETLGMPEGLELEATQKKSEIAWFGKKVTFENCLEIGKIVTLRMRIAEDWQKMFLKNY